MKLNELPCKCWNENKCNGYVAELIGMKRTRFVWQGCTRRGVKSTIPLWSVNHRSRNVKGMKSLWSHLVSAPKPSLFTAPVAPMISKPSLFGGPSKPSIFGGGA